MPPGQATWDAAITCLFIGPPEPAEGREPLQFQPVLGCPSSFLNAAGAAQPRGLKLILELAGGITAIQTDSSCQMQFVNIIYKRKSIKTLPADSGPPVPTLRGAQQNVVVCKAACAF